MKIRSFALLLVLLICSFVWVLEMQKPDAGAISTDKNLLIEYLVPKVILEGKWGTAPGEFGGMLASEPEEMRTYRSPDSVEINSKGEMYVLDEYNNRIQKFDKDGQYIKSIKVLSFARENGGPVPIIKYYAPGIISDYAEKPYYSGFSIQMDSKDNLYYHCGMGNKTEVWVFIDDQCVKKWDVSKAEKGALFIGYYPEEVIWIGDQFPFDSNNMLFNVTEGRYYTTKEYSRIVDEKRKNVDVKILCKLPLRNKYYYFLTSKMFKILFVVTDYDLGEGGTITKDNKIRFYVGNASESEYDLGDNGVIPKDNKIRIEIGRSLDYKNGGKTFRYDKDLLFNFNGKPEKLIIRPDASFSRKDSYGWPIIDKPLIDINGIKFIKHELQINENR